MKIRFLAALISGTFISSCAPQTARIVLLPDTQYYAEKYPEIVHAQTDWVLKEAQNIDFVLQQGDLTNNNSDAEWEVIRNAFVKLDNKVPYVLAAGNHDMGSAPRKIADVRETKLFNSYFPYSKMRTLPGFGGTFENGKMENSWYQFKTGKVNWLVLSLEFGPRNSVLRWADSLVSAHPNQTVIVNTHAYMYSDSTRVGEGDNWRPQAYGLGKDKGVNAVNDGEQMWDKFIRNHPNIRFVFSGHILKSGLGTLISQNDRGLPVYQMLANYQTGVVGSKNGGNGFLRILDMDFKKRTVKVRTFSPYINEYKTEPGQDFVFEDVLFNPDK